jgi:general secretion pathway protein L
MTATDIAPRGGLAGFLDWWLTTLGGLLPSALKPSTETVEAVVEGDHLVLRRRRGGGWRELRRLRADDHTLAADIDAPVTLRLAAGQALEQTLTLPAAARDELDQVVGFEIDRRTPFRADQVHRLWRISGQDRAARTLTVALTVVPKSTVDGLVRRLETAGARVGAVRLPDGRALALPGLATTRRGIGGLNWALLVLLVALSVAALALPPWRAQAELGALQAEIAAMKPKVDAQLEAHDSTWQRQRTARAAVQAKLAAPSAVALLEEITHRLPDDTWLVQFNLVDGRIEIEGSTASAAALVGLLEAAPGIERVQFQAPVTTDAVSKRERFQFRIHLAKP